MTQQLLSLRKKMDGAKAVYDTIGMQNINGRSPEDLVQMDIETHHAKKIWLSAYSEYQAALEAHVKE